MSYVITGHLHGVLKSMGLNVLSFQKLTLIRSLFAMRIEKLSGWIIFLYTIFIQRIYNNYMRYKI